MKILYVTNYISFHTKDLFLCLKNKFKCDVFCFSHLPPSEDRVAIGDSDYSNLFTNVDFDYIRDCDPKIFDIVILSYFEKHEMIVLSKFKYCFVMTEHFLKNNSIRSRLSLALRGLRLKKYFKKNLYLLCNSSFVGRELRPFIKKNHIYKFGYFPDFGESFINHEKLFNHEITWSGRYIDWKHPEIALNALSYFSKHGNYLLNYVGFKKEDASFLDSLETEKVKVLGRVSRSKNLEILLNSEVFIFSSSKGEGWGCILNEALSSGCVCFCSSKAGSTNYLVRNGINGYIFKNKKELDLRIEEYMKLSDSMKFAISKEAQNTMKNLWNYKVAAERLFVIFECLCKNTEPPTFVGGPLSLDK